MELAQPVPGQPDFVFAANAGLVVDGTVILSRFRYAERAPEERYWRAWFQARGFAVFNLPPGLRFEGEGDALLCGGLLVTGFGFRSDREAVLRAGELLEKETLVLELANPWFYHLDTCFCPLDPETVLYYPQAFIQAIQHAIRMRFPGAVAVPSDEAYRFVCNSIVIGHDVVMAPDCPMPRAELLALGYQVHEVEVSEFLKAGGGAKCLALFIERNGRLAGKRETVKRKGAAVAHDA